MSVHETLCTLLVLALPWAVVSAQSPLPPDAAAPGAVRVGPFDLTPGFEILNAGMDSNVFNEADGAREDFTATLRPSLGARIRFGPGRLLYRSWLDAVYFHEFESQRAVNRFGELRGELRFTRFVPYVHVSGLDTTDRPNNEIDLRARRRVHTAGAGIAVAVFSRTALVASARRETTRYDDAQEFGGEDLAEQLNSVGEIVDGGIRVALTPLTTFTLLGSREVAEFDRSPDRNATSYRIGPQLDFDPTALISGTVAVAYRRFEPTGSLRPYTGLVAQVVARYTLQGTSVVGRFRRDLEYSFEEAQPYYITTGGGLTVTQRVIGALDVQGTASRERLAYQARTDVDPATLDGNDTDTTNIYGGGIGYRLRDNARLGVNIEFATREAHRERRSYDRRRVFASLTYGF